MSDRMIEISRVTEIATSKAGRYIRVDGVLVGWFVRTQKGVYEFILTSDLKATIDNEIQALNSEQAGEQE